jgi:hypothetical protein
MLFTTSGYGQGAGPRQSKPENKIAVQRLPASNPENKAAAESQPPSELENEVAAVKAENAAVREHLRKMEEQNKAMAEQQKTLLELVDSLKRRIDGVTTADALPPMGTSGALPGADAATPSSIDGTASAPVATVNAKKDEDRYQDGIIIWKTPDDATVPFSIKFNINTQFRYLNTLNSPQTFTDHLGNVREVHRRNDLTVNRAMFTLSGFIFDRRLQYSFTAWTAAGAASIVLAGNIGWRFNKHLTITGGYNGAPGSRSLVNTFPFFTGMDRSLADNFFRPGFSQGVWASGEIVEGLYYNAMVGNGLNQLNVSAAKIDTNLLLSGSVWWEPLGAYGEPGKSRNMYDDYFAQEKVRIRVGTAFTRSREDRFTNLDISNPDNTALYNSDGVLTFATGAFAPGVTLDKALMRLWAVDGGLKYNGLAINGQYYTRWVNEFEADGPLPIAEMFDHGGELMVSYFVFPRKLALYGRGSQVFGEFNNSWEYAGGAKWHFLPTERLWLSAEVMKVHRAPYTGAFTPYTAGMNGWVPMVQTVLAF